MVIGLSNLEEFLLVLSSSLLALAVSPLVWRRGIARALSTINPLARYIRAPRRRDALRPAVLGLRLAAAVLLALYVSQPLIIEEREVERTLNVSGVVDVGRLVGTPLVLALDVSGSMLFESKLDMAKDAVRNLTMSLPKEYKLGYVAFSDVVKVVVPPTANRSRVLEALNSTVGGGGTLYGPMFRAVENLLKPYMDSNVTGHVVLLSDGAPSDGDFWPLVRLLAKRGFAVHAVYVGKDEGGLRTLRGIVNETGGVLVVSEPSGLLHALSSVGRQLEDWRLDAPVIARVTTQVRTSRPLDAPYLQISILLFIAAWAITAYRYRTLL